MHILVKHQGHEDAQLVSCIDAFNISCRICFCKTFFLGIFQCGVIVHVFLAHLVQDVVGRAVYDAEHFGVTVCPCCTLQGCQHRNAAANTGLKFEHNAVSRSCFRQTRIVSCYSCFIRRNDMLAAVHGTFHERSCRFYAAQQFDNDIDFRIHKNVFRVRNKLFSGNGDITLAVDILLQDFHDVHLCSQFLLNDVSVHLESLVRTCSDVAQSEQSDLDFFHGDISLSYLLFA